MPSSRSAAYFSRRRHEREEPELPHPPFQTQQSGRRSEEEKKDMAGSPTLRLPRSTFAKLSPHPYLLANLQPTEAGIRPARTNGRQADQARAINAHASSLSHAHGSAVIRSGDTTVICGVRGETLLASAIANHRREADEGGEEGEEDERAAAAAAAAAAVEAWDYDLLVPNIELATGCAPSFLPGVPPTTLAQTLSTRLYALLHGSGLVEARQLRIRQRDQDSGTGADAVDDGARAVRAYWVLYIDLLFVSFDGNAFDAAWAAVLAALGDTELPSAYYDPDREMVLCAGGSPGRRLRLRGFPVACTAAVFSDDKERRRTGSGRYWLLLDPDRLEEELCEETVTIVLDRQSGSTRLLGVSKSGGTVVGPVLIRELTAQAEARWADFRAAVAPAHP